MFEKLFQVILESSQILFIPLLHLYHTTCSDIVLNVAREDATGMEKAANELLIPYHFVFCGQVAARLDDGHWELHSRFPVDDAFWPKMGASLLTLPASVAFGGVLKSLSFFSQETRDAYRSIQKSLKPESIVSNLEKYQKQGLPIALNIPPKTFDGLHLPRRSGDENHLKETKRALKEIGNCLNEHQIPWWVDCGTCIGVYRYGGIIPWDLDVDMAILIDDFDNVRRALHHLDPNLYVVEDWSGRDRPKSALKVFLKEDRTWIDIYCFKILETSKMIDYIFALENNTFMPKDWVAKEKRCFSVLTPYDTLFPLKKAKLDDVDVFVPNDPEKYLKLRYGENLSPVMVFNSETHSYEKDETHPYWTQ